MLRILIANGFKSSNLYKYVTESDENRSFLCCEKSSLAIKHYLIQN